MKEIVSVDLVVDNLDRLSFREREIVGFVLAGRPIRLIGEHYHVSRARIYQILQKIGQKISRWTGVPIER